MSYLVLAYPDLNEADYELIQDCRREKDSLYFDVVDPHFSFVFAVNDIEEEMFVQEATEKAKDQHKINFVIRCATISKDGFEDSFHVFLVPDEGHSSIIRLHDRLYSGLFKDHLRLDLDYIPHMAIGNSTDRFQSKQWVDGWNQKHLIIHGAISKLSIVKYEDNVVTLIKEIELLATNYTNSH
jgi:hypothetical protein